MLCNLRPWSKPSPKNSHHVNEVLTEVQGHIDMLLEADILVPVELDYEAAARVLAIRCDGISPDGDWESEATGFTIKARAREDARAIVDAALQPKGDTT